MDTLTQTLTCSIKMLPPDKWVAAAEEAALINPANAPAIGSLCQAAPGVRLEPQHLAVLTAKYWGPRVRLTVGFMDRPQPDLRERILAHMNAWGRWANVSFVAASTDPQVRIARLTGESGGYWSYLGTDVLQVDSDQPTMNLEGFTTRRRPSWPPPSSAWPADSRT